MLIYTLLACLSAPEPTIIPETKPAPTPEAKTAPTGQADPTEAEQDATVARARDWAGSATHYPGIPETAYTVDCEDAPMCVVHIPERGATHYLNCEGVVCTEDKAEMNPTTQETP